ncbi:acyl-CoA--sterol O-acyltransferase 1 [Carica papaya]|uniref:acyl-CoA--sterol O-acyltransferase 1 n=1 Tax=Carica papaya TaxID=3649 RepID=UPI000B8CF65F|nr:acyl-CoA--sterol O-acyltransferase 1 [Carica papaya]
MEEEIRNLIKIWLTVIPCLYYCYRVGNFIPKGFTRLIFFLPIISIFFFLPLNLHSPHLLGTTGFFLSWLANFKLLLFAFSKGPLSSHPNITFPLFLSLSCLPIKLQQKTNLGSKSQKHPSPKPKEGPVNYTIKGLCVAALIKLYDYSEYIHPKVILLLYAFHIYFLLELILAMVAALARAFIGLELEPQFDEPYLATSLQDFWGRRWNLMVTSIMHPTVYEPTREIFSPVIGRRWAPLPAFFTTFLASGVMHELMFYYLARLPPTGEITSFFLIHGFCSTVEIGLKKLISDRWRFPRVISCLLTVGFVLVTGSWLFLPQFTKSRIDEKAFEDYAAVGAFVKNISKRALEIVV